MPSEITPFGHASTRFLPLFEQELARVVQLPDAPKLLAEAMRYSLLQPGKRIRPLLVLLACELLGTETQKALPAACAVEMIHTFSLIHDDLPGMDNDDLRRGKPTNHKVYGEAQAILAGDALLAHAFFIMTTLESSEHAVECMRILANATGPNGMCGGQSIDMQGLGNGATIEQVKGLHLLKTGALIQASVAMGGIVGGAAEKEQGALLHYGKALGLLFQVTDDLLDCTADTKTLGKTAGKDEAQGKQTFATILGVETARTYAKSLTQEALLALAVFGKKAEALASLAETIRDRNH